MTVTDQDRLAPADRIDAVDFVVLRDCPMVTKFDHENKDELLSGDDQNLIVQSLRALAQSGGEPVAWEDIATQLFAVDGLGFFCDASPKQREAYTIRAKAVAALYAAPIAGEPGAWREALEFYADRKNWITSEWGDGTATECAIPVTKEDGSSVCDCGDRARAALTAPQPAAEEREEMARIILSNIFPAFDWKDTDFTKPTTSMRQALNAADVILSLMPARETGR